MIFQDQTAAPMPEPLCNTGDQGKLNFPSFCQIFKTKFSNRIGHARDGLHVDAKTAQNGGVNGRDKAKTDQKREAPRRARVQGGEEFRRQ